MMLDENAMKEVKCFVHRHRAADVIHALKAAGFNRLSFNDVKGALSALDPEERVFSVEAGEEVIQEVKIEFVCEARRVTEAVTLLRKHGRTDQPVSGWIFVTRMEETHVIEGGNKAG